MIPAAPPAIHYHVSVTCDDAPCTLPVAAIAYGGGGSPTPVPPRFSVLRLRIDPEPVELPSVTWHSDDAAIAYPSQTNPFVQILRLPGDTSATPEPDMLQTLLIPGFDPATRSVGAARGVTSIEADIGPPVNVRISIPVFCNQGQLVPPPAMLRKHYAIETTPLRGAASIQPHFNASIAYADPAAPTYGTPATLFTEIPWPDGYGIMHPTATVRAMISPQPFTEPAVTWRIDGSSVTLKNIMNTVKFDATIAGLEPGRSALIAHIDAPVNQDVSIPVISYATFVLPCGHGIRFSSDGKAVLTENESDSDLYLACGNLHVPQGGVLLTNGNDPTLPVPEGVVRGPQFPELTASLWQPALTSIDLNRYRTSAASRENRTMPGKTLLFRTRDGRYVKWLLQTGNGLDLLAGPYEVL